MKTIVYLILAFLVCSCGQEVTRIKDPYLNTDSVEAEQSVNNMVTGFDMNGIERTCTPIDWSVTTCTQVFTASDQFGNDCRNSGKVAVACGCHSWICLE